MEQLGSADPQRIGGYHLLGRLGAGGMGEVFLARSDRGRTVAVKLVRPELAAQDEFRSRFRQEVQAAQRVGGQWTAPVLDADTEASVPWVATGYIAGPSLHHVVARSHGPLAEASVRVLAAGLAYALRDIHAAGLVHRDLKPSNVLVTIDGPRVIDFGIARALETVADGGLTRTGAVIGSPGFMSPEQVRGSRVTTASDVFCLGSVLAFAATGQLPFGSPDSGSHALMYRIAEEEPDLSELPDGLVELISDCLHKEAARRPTLAEILERTGAEAAVGDGRVRDPWLPGALTAELARHAVELLNREYMGDDGPPAGGAPIGAAEAEPHPADPDAASSASKAASPPDGAAQAPQGPTPPPGGSGNLIAGYPPPPAHTQPPNHPYPQHTPYTPAPGYPGAVTSPYAPMAPHSPYPPRPLPPKTSSSVKVVIVLAVVAVVLGGGLLRLLDNDAAGTGTDRPSPGPTSGSPSEDGKSSGSSSGGSDGPTDQGGSTDKDAGAVPKEFLGTWRASFGAAGGGTNVRMLTIRQGAVGETVMTLVGTGPDHSCRWSATLRSAGPPLELNDSKLTERTRGSCSPGEWSRLTLSGQGTLARELVGSGGTPLTYHRVGSD